MKEFLNFQISKHMSHGGQKVALADCGKVKRHQHSQQTHRERQTTKCSIEETVELVNNLVLSQEDTSQTHRTVRQISRLQDRHSFKML